MSALESLPDGVSADRNTLDWKPSSTGAPLYQQLARWLEQRVRSGEYPKGSRLPGDTQLAKELGLSVITVRAAMRTLCDKRLIRRHAGKGTFVLDASEHRATWGLGSIEDLLALGATTPIDLLSASFVTPPRKIATRFGDAKDELFHCRTLRSSDGEPFVVTDLYLSASFGRKLAQIDLASALNEKRVFYLVVDDVCGVEVTDIWQSMGAELARGSTSRILNVPSGTPVFTVAREYFTSDGTLVLIGFSSHRVDHYEYTFNLKRTRDDRA